MPDKPATAPRPQGDQQQMSASNAFRAALPADSSPSAGPELRRVLANIRVLVALVAATEAISLAGASHAPGVLAALGYAAYAGWLYWAELNGNRPALSPVTSWVDATWILLLLWLAQANSSLLTLLLLFPVLFAALSFGFSSGLLVSLFATAGAAAMHYMIQSGSPDSLSPDGMLRPLSILVLGPLVAGLARAGIQMNEQVTIADRLLGEVDPRLGVQRVGESLLNAFMRHFDADLGLLLVWLADSEPRLFHCDGHGKFNELSGDLRDTLLEALDRLPAGIAAAHCVTRVLGRLPIRYHAGLHIDTGAPTDAARAAADHLAELLDARSMVATPICRRAPHPCRLLLASQRRRYRSRDADLLCRIMDQLAPVIENAGLLERLTEEAMATERARIGRDLHDNAIQPYLGLKYGIEALARRAAADNPLHADIHALQEVALGELHHLRELVSGMRDGAGSADDALAPALRRQARRFSELFGIDVEVRCDGDLAVSRKLAAEVFPLVSEALTNIRRHTAAARAEIEVGTRSGELVLRIGSTCDAAGAPPAPFVPRAIVERAESIGGRAIVDLQKDDFAELIISIPMTSRAPADHGRDRREPDTSVSCR